MTQATYKKILYSTLVPLLFLSLISFVLLVNQSVALKGSFETAAMAGLLTFLSLLILRYFVLLWFSYLDHIELGFVEDTNILPSVTILVPCYNEGKVVEASVRSLLELDYPAYEVIVVDDGSTDDTYERAKRWEGDHHGRTVRVLTKPNSGKANALNYGIQHASGDIILCMDGDSKMAPQTLRKGVRHFRDPSVGAVAGNVKVINRGNMWARLQALEYIEGLNMARRAQSFFHSVNIIPGPCGFFRRKVLHDVGLYDDDTFAEDCDLTLKILMSGWKIKYEPSSIAYTEAPENLLDLIKQRYRWTRGILQAVRKHKGSMLFKHGISHALILWYFLFEGVFWPIMNIFANLFFLYLAMFMGLSVFLFCWWIQLTLLDVVAAIHCVAMEEEDLSLVPYSVLYRLFFILIIDVCKIAATFEEMIGLGMDWGKLERVGRI